MKNRWSVIAISIGEIVGVGLIFGFILVLLQNKLGLENAWGRHLNAYLIGVIIWILVVGFTPLINYFFVIVPKNSGAVVVNTLATYRDPRNDAERTTLQPTLALREIGPGLQGILIWEKIGWIIDLGKQIDLGTQITAYSRDNIELKIDWQVILTPLRGCLTNLVRHSDDTVKKYFEGLFKAKIIELVSREYAQEVIATPGVRASKSVIQRIERLKDEFNSFLGGPKAVSEIEEQYGTFTNNPILVSISRSPAFQQSVESLLINKNNAEAIQNLRKQGGLEANQATIAVLASQGKETEGLIDVNIRGLENAEIVALGAGMMPFAGKNRSNKSKNKKGKTEDE